MRGSNRNFAYAGAKFGGIGLTQSFAMELAPHRIKVNSVCPGNFYEGPLWSDPHNGLFVQYLKTGKVPGAKTIEDVRKFYEDQVPMKRGCKLEDVMKALLYIIDQEYETGQACSCYRRAGDAGVGERRAQSVQGSMVQGSLMVQFGSRSLRTLNDKG